MKIAISARGDSLESPFEERFGRSPDFIIFDTETKGARHINNKQNLNLPQGAGIQAAQNVIREGVSAVITGHCGPKAYQVLKSKGVKIYYGSFRTAREALEAFQRGELKEAESHDVEGHWS